MAVFVVMLNDPYATHFCGAYESKEAAQQYIDYQDRGEFDDEIYVIDEIPVQKLIR